MFHPCAASTHGRCRAPIRTEGKPAHARPTARCRSGSSQERPARPASRGGHFARFPPHYHSPVPPWGARSPQPARYRAFLTLPQRSTRRIDGFSFRLSPTPGSPATDGSRCCAEPSLLTSRFASAKGAQWPPPNLNSARLSRERAGEGPCWSRGGGARREESGERRGGIGAVLCAVTRSGRSCWAFPAVPARCGIPESYSCRFGAGAVFTLIYVARFSPSRTRAEVGGTLAPSLAVRGCRLRSAPRLGLCSPPAAFPAAAVASRLFPAEDRGRSRHVPRPFAFLGVIADLAGCYLQVSPDTSSPSTPTRFYPAVNFCFPFSALSRLEKKSWNVFPCLSSLCHPGPLTYVPFPFALVTQQRSPESLLHQRRCGAPLPPIWATRAVQRSSPSHSTQTPLQALSSRCSPCAASLPLASRPAAVEQSGASGGLWWAGCAFAPLRSRRWSGCWIGAYLAELLPSLVSALCTTPGLFQDVFSWCLKEPSILLDSIHSNGAGAVLSLTQLLPFLPQCALKSPVLWLSPSHNRHHIQPVSFSFDQRRENHPWRWISPSKMEITLHR